MRFPQGAEWLIILVLILLLFGAKRLPEAARGLGRSLRIIKSETKGLREDDPDEETVQLPTGTQAPAVQAAQAPAGPAPVAQPETDQASSRPSAP